MWYSSLQSALSGGDVVAAHSAKAGARELGRIHSMPHVRDKNACCVIDGADVPIYGATSLTGEPSDDVSRPSAAAD
jgi:hypothetical protein